jgi:hypothetical protein
LDNGVTFGGVAVRKPHSAEGGFARRANLQGVEDVTLIIFFGWFNVEFLLIILSDYAAIR